MMPHPPDSPATVSSSIASELDQRRSRLKRDAALELRVETRELPPPPEEARRLPRLLEGDPELPRCREDGGRDGLRVGGRDSLILEEAGGAAMEEGSEEPARRRLGEPRSNVPEPVEGPGTVGALAVGRLPVTKDSSGRGSRS